MLSIIKISFIGLTRLSWTVIFTSAEANAHAEAKFKAEAIFGAMVKHKRPFVSAEDGAGAKVTSD